MTPKEQEIAIGELEERVDRLRNLYEQYFLGFEKLEPSVSRKDVDRRFMLLRKEQIRNTAMRFRFNVVTQKYNTYAMHWVRICRQIEDGTYKRHVRKAKARFGDVARAGAEKDMSIDIDIGDFETDDVDALLEEANAAAETYARDAADTIPPAAAQSMVQDKAAMQARARELLLATPGTSFAMGGGREVIDDLDSAPPSASFRDRAARGAALPPGAKPRILRKRDDTEPPPSGKTLPGGPPSSSSLETRSLETRSLETRSLGSPVGRGSSPDLGPASSRMASSPNLPGGAQSRPRIAPVGTNATAKAAQSAGQIPASSRSVGQSAGRIDASTPSAGAPAAGRIPAASPQSSAGPMRAAPPAAQSSAGRIVAAPPAPPAQPAPPAAQSSSGRIPVPAPAPGAPPGLRPPPAMPSAGRLPLAAPPPPPSDRRLPAAPPGAPSRPSVPGKAAPPAGPPAPRPPMQSVSDAGPPSDARPSIRPRAPLPLPSQSARPKKE